MDKSLDALSDVLTQIAEKPYDVALHIRHITLAQSNPGLQAELESALEMMPEFLAADPEHVWLPLIQLKEQSLDLDTAAGVEELLALYERAEGDYLSLLLLQRHLRFVVERYEKYHGEDSEMKPIDLGELFSLEWTRQSIAHIVSKSRHHLTESHTLWDVQRDWELERLEETPSTERGALIKRVEELFLERLRQPHSNHDETFQLYSSFTTQYKPAAEYESLLVEASKIRSHAVQAFERRQQHEDTLKQHPSPQSYASYIGFERRAKYPGIYAIQGIYERAITDAASRRFKGEIGAEEALRSFWSGYLDALRIVKTDSKLELQIAKRASRSVPASGEVWARYLRLTERLESDDTEESESLEDIHSIFTKALETKVVQEDIEQLIPLILARAGYERRKIESGDAEEDSLPTLIGILESGIEMVAQVSKAVDSRFRLEKTLADAYDRLAQMPEGTIAIWKGATKRAKSSYLVWLAYTESLIKHQNYDEARNTFSDICMKHIDWSEAIWEAWISFENSHGRLQDIEACLDKVEKAQYQVNARRVKEAEKAALQQMQMSQADDVIQEAVNTAMDNVASVSNVATAGAMVIDTQAQGQNRGTKRSAEEASTGESSKRVKTEPTPPPLKRDRENCTVFVADLPSNVTEDSLTKLFKDCGNIRELKITALGDSHVAMVEFQDRDSVPAALTKDKKRVDAHEVAVSLAWKSTLYVTNFPESTDDKSIRSLFSQYGTIFEVRWPSKKFKATRRFCYVQYTSPAAAEAALELHNREIEGLPISVYISNPERKKERTDRDANEREVYVAGLSKYTTKAELEKLFQTYGKVKEVRMAAEEDGHARGYAFVEYEDPADARAALSANNHELKRRRIAVTLVDPRVRARHKTIGETGLTRTAEIKQRSLRITGLPANTQEGLLQQTLEKLARVKRVEVFESKHEAVVELENAAEAGKLLLWTEPIVFNGHTLRLSQKGSEESAAPPPKAAGMFVPRRAKGARSSRPGIGHTSTATPSSGGSSSKGQDDFRKLLMGGK